MKLFGMTGGIGMGKTTAGDLLRRRGVAVVDTDLIARQVVEPGQPALLEIKTTFGAQMLQPDGRLNREALAHKVFADASARGALEAMLHPRIREIWQAEVEGWRRQDLPVGVVIIPLLFETGSAALFEIGRAHV